MLLSVFFILYTITKSAPNFIFILTDDQDKIFNSTDVMPNLNSYIASNGVTFENGFISTPICCPSRTESITGRNYQNIGTPNGSCMHVDTINNIFNNPSSMFAIFQSNNYLTGSFGKLTNDMSKFFCQKNVSDNNFSVFNRVHCPCDFNNFYGLQYSQYYMNGSFNMYDIPLTPNAHETPLTGNATISWINDLVNTGNTKPFVAWVGFHSPHYPAQPTEWYGDKFNDVYAPRTLNFNVSSKEHHGFLSTNPPFDNTSCPTFIDELYRDRLRTLLAVDDFIGELVNTLKNTNLLDDTYIIFSSDHGYHLGQWRVPCSKEQPYDTDLRIPIMISGPNIKKNIKLNNIVGNIDYLPTMLDLANIKYDTNTYDGISWKSFITENSVSNNNAVNNRQIFLSQYLSVGTYGFSHCQTWFPEQNGTTFPGKNINPPENNADGQAWLVDSTSDNNWRAIRIINDTTDIMYAEFYNASDWNYVSGFKKPWFYEYYDMKNDYYQLNNIYNTLSDVQKKELSDILSTIGVCAGNNCLM